MHHRFFKSQSLYIFAIVSAFILYQIDCRFDLYTQLSNGITHIQDAWDFLYAHAQSIDLTQTHILAIAIGILVIILAVKIVTS